VKRIKILGLAVVAAMALSAVAGAASASATQFRAEEYPTTVNGTQTSIQKLTKPGGNSFSCSTVNTTGTLSAAAKTVTVTPEMKSCTYAGLNATVNPNSCKYVLTSTNEAAPFTGTLDISCSKGGDSIEVLGAAGCFLKIPAQSGLAASLANDDSSIKSRNRKVTVSLNATGVKYEGNCFSDVGLHSDGTLTGTSVIKGYNTPAAHAVGVYLANEQVNSPPLFSNEGVGGTIVSEPVTTMHIQVNGQTASCTNFALSGGMPAFGDEKLDLNVSAWSGCYYGGEFAVNPNGCSMRLRATTGEGTSIWGVLDVNCPAGKAFTFTSLGCSYSIPAQTNRSQMNYANAGAGASRTVTATFGVSGLKYTKNCGSTSTFEDGSLTGAVKLKGVLAGGASTGLWIVS
jgi:hypothetical protein